MILTMGASAKPPIRSAQETSSNDNLGKGFDEHLLETSQVYAKQPAVPSTRSIPFAHSQTATAPVKLPEEEAANSNNSEELLAGQEAPSEAVRSCMTTAPRQDENRIPPEEPQLNSTNQGEHIPLLSLQAQQNGSADAVRNEPVVAYRSGTNAPATAGNATNLAAPHEKKKAEKTPGMTPEKIRKGQTESQTLDTSQPEPVVPSLVYPIHAGEPLQTRHPADVPTHSYTAAHNHPGRSDEITSINRDEVANNVSDAGNDRTATRQHTIQRTEEIHEAGVKSASKQHEGALEPKAHFATTLNQEGNSIAFSRVMQTQGAVSAKANLAETVVPMKVAGKEGEGFSRVSTSQTPNAHQLLAATPKTLEVGVATDSHGWLRVRAELANDGRVNALMSSRSETVQQSLHKELGPLTNFLQSERVPFGTVAVQRDFYGGRGAALGNATDPNQHSKASPDSQGGSRRTVPDFGRLGQGWRDVSNGEGQEVGWPAAYDGMGSWLSVMA